MASNLEVLGTSPKILSEEFNHIACTQEYYDNLEVKDHNTIYFVNSEQEVTQANGEEVYKYTDLYYGSNKLTDVVILDHEPSSPEEVGSLPVNKLYLCLVGDPDSPDYYRSFNLYTKIRTSQGDQLFSAGQFLFKNVQHYTSSSTQEFLVIDFNTADPDLQDRIFIPCWESDDFSFVIDQSYNPESSNAQSGKAVAEAIDSSRIEVDQTYQSESSNPQSGKAISQALQDVSNEISQKISEIPPATSTTLGLIKVGDNLAITEDGTLSAINGSSIEVLSGDGISVVKEGNSTTISAKVKSDNSLTVDSNGLFVDSTKISYNDLKDKLSSGDGIVISSENKVSVSGVDDGSID